MFRLPNNLSCARGITLIETLLTITLIAIISAITPPILRVRQAFSNITQARSQIVHVLRQAQQFAEDGHFDTSWGVYVSDAGVVLFQGTTYLPDSSLNIITEFSDDIVVDGGSHTIVFSQGTGLPDLAEEILLSLEDGTTFTISISSYGAISS